MPFFSYIALRSDSLKKINSSVFADDLEDLELKLKHQNLTLLSAKEVKKNESFGFIRKHIKHSLSDKELIYFFLYLSQLTRAGVQVSDALHSLYEETRYVKIKRLALSLSDMIKRGSSLCEAMQIHHEYFKDIYIKLIKVGEETNNLSVAFDYIIQYIRTSSNINKKIKMALRYPLFMLLVCLLMMFGASTLVLPKFAAFLQDQNVPLPFYTTLLIDVSNFLRKHYPSISLIMGLMIIIPIAMMNNKKTRPIMDHIVIRLPFISDFVKKIEITRFAMFFRTVISSGVYALEAFEESMKVVKNTVILHEFQEVRAKIIGGTPIAIALMGMRDLPRFALRMFRTAENSGDLQTSMENIVHFYTQDIDNTTTVVVGLIKPVMIILLGLILGWISLAIFGPVYAQIANLQNKAL